MSRFFAARALGCCAVLVLAATAATADTPTLLGVSQNWSAFTQGSGGAKTCYAISKPTASNPRKKRDAIYFLITDWPGRRAKAEPEVVPGYQYRDGAPVTAAVGGARFAMFSKNEDGQGAAWVRERADEIKLIEAMQSGRSVVVSGTSLRGTRTTDTYSLAGLGDALDKIHSACGF